MGEQRPPSGGPDDPLPEVDDVVGRHRRSGGTGDAAAQGRAGPQDRIGATGPVGSDLAAPEDAPPPTPSRPSARRRRVRIGVAAGLGAILLVGGFGGLTGALGGQDDRRQLAVSPARVEIVSDDVDIDLDSRSDGVEITQHVPLLASSCSPEAAMQGDTLRVELSCRGFAGSDEARVEAPTGVPVEVHTDSGDVRGTVEGASLTARTTSGDIDVETGAATLGIDVRSTSGEIRADVRGETEGTAVTARSVSGDIDVRTSEGTRSIDTEAISGDIEVLPGGGPFRLDVATVSGDRDVEVAESVSAGQTIRAHTTSGDVSIED